VRAGVSKAAGLRDLVRHRAPRRGISRPCGVPWWLIAAIHEREASQGWDKPLEAQAYFYAQDEQGNSVLSGDAGVFTGGWQQDLERLGIRVSIEKAAATVGGIVLADMLQSSAQQPCPGTLLRAVARRWTRFSPFSPAKLARSDKDQWRQ
jgi:hypothetical protein